MKDSELTFDRTCHGLLDILPALCNADYAGMERPPEQMIQRQQSEIKNRHKTPAENVSL